MIRYLLHAAGERFAWGTADCWLLVADWCRTRRDVDPAALVRGRYTTPLGAQRLARRLGGLERMARAAMAQAGIPETAEPRAGDVGLIRDPVTGPLFAVRSTLGWIARGRAGLSLVSHPLIVAWRL